MGENYGKFSKKPGGYRIEKLPEAGNYEYIYKNDETLVKVDQYGIITAQINPPVGEAVFKREEREVGSPVKAYFSDGESVFNNFDALRADKLTIDFLPEKSIYRLTFGKTEVVTELFVTEKNKRFVMNVTVKNLGEQVKEYSILKCAFPYLNELLMAPWDKPEWYTRTEYLKDKNAFLTTKYSVAGKKEERRYLTIVSNDEINNRELSLERLTALTKNFSVIPDKVGGVTEDTLYAFKQCVSTLATVNLKGGESYSFTQVFAVTDDEKKIVENIENSVKYFDSTVQKAEEEKLAEKHAELFSVRTVKTGDPDFDSFVNGFLPLEMYWVSSLDRGWPTGMRGVRDAANDFEGMLCYDKQMCKGVIENIFSKQRGDGWYPRQVPFGTGTKFDLREFVDSACFFTEYVYDYLAYTGDYSILENKYGYYDCETQESGLTHLKKGMDYLLSDDALGVHGLVKMRGGDWLDCLSGAGKKGRGESVMVSCQLVMCLKYLVEILNKVGQVNEVEKYEKAGYRLKNAINKAAFNGRFYNAVYTDNDTWLFSEKDEDGEERVYVPTNAYAVISGVASGKENEIFNEIAKLKTSDGYKLFSKPLGGKFIDGIGKMGTGDFQPYFAENGSVYNHGSQCFLIRALAKAGRYEEISDVLGYALPLYADKHSPEKTCSAPYAITNCYHLVPSFYGRSGFSFLTGSVAMIERAVYSWVFGLNFALNNIVITPCVPKEYANAEITTPFNGHNLTIKYVGYGAQIEIAEISGKSFDVSAEGRSVLIDKALITDDLTIIIKLK
ncbi:MAG: GH36-type glycosyl hydrolase domain-containing protein [Coriobacteriales bacterium]|jgi:cyclic beta 1-2 glucan synthetase domain protein